MKKSIKFLGLAVLAMGLMVACKNNQPAEEEPIDSMIEEVVEPIEEEVIDTVAVVEEAQQAAKPAKKVEAKKDNVKAADKGILKKDARTAAESGEMKEAENDGSKTGTATLGKKKDARDAFRK